MRVVAKVHESRIGFIESGQTADLKLDSMPELTLTGCVSDVSEYPMPPISVYMGACERVRRRDRYQRSTQRSTAGYDSGSQYLD